MAAAMEGLLEVRSDTTTSPLGLACPTAEGQTRLLQPPALQKVSALCAGLLGGRGFPGRQLGIVLSACLATPTLDACSSVRPLWPGGTRMKKPPELCPCRWERNVWIPLSREQRFLCPRTRPVRISSQLAPPRIHTGTNYFWMRSTWAVPQCQWLV